jgi:hypothetical protein
MKSQKNELATLSEQQTSPNLCDPRDFEVIEAGDTPKMTEAFHGQCGSSKAEYEKLLREGEVCANASNFSSEGERHPNVNDAKNNFALARE